MGEQTDLHPPGPSRPPVPPGGAIPGGSPPIYIEPPRRRRSHTAALATAALVVVAAAAALIGHDVWSVRHTVTVPRAPSSSYPFPGSAAPGAPANTEALAAATYPTLVDVNTTLPYQAAEAAGTGMVLTANGEILTNNHVIEGAGSISVTDVGNGRTYAAVVVGYSRSDDVAVLQLSKASGLETIAAGDSSQVAVGDGVVAVGNAGGAGGTPAYAGGAITATGQTITASDEANGTSETLSGLLQTNAQIVAGDSGGALVATNARVIGMTTAGSTGFQLQATYGYAIPLNAALSVARQIESGQASSTVHIGPTAFLGVHVQSPTSGTAGAQIVQTIPGGPAADAGLSAGDTITALAGQAIGSPADLTDAMLAQKPGTTTAIGYLDPSGQPHTATVHLTSGPPQ